MIAAWFLSLAWGATIDGQITDADGNNIADALVLAYDERLKYQYDYTGQAGKFTIEELDRSDWRLRVLPPPGVNAVETYLPDAWTLCDAERVTMKGQPIDIGVVALPSGGVASGRLLLDDGTPVVGAEVLARTVANSAAALPRSGYTDAYGYFTVAGIPLEADGDTWRFEVEADGLPDQYLGQVYEPDIAPSWTVEPGPAVELGEHVLLRGATLSGTVLGPDGPVADGKVSAVTTGRIRTATLVDGAWTIAGLAPGSALVWAEGDGLATSWYPDADRPGPTIQVVEGGAIDGVDLVLPPEGVLTGRFVGADDFTGTTLTLVNDDRSVTWNKKIDADGSFAIEGLRAATFTMELHPAAGLPFVDGPMTDDEGVALTAKITAGGTLDLGEVLPTAGATIEGVVRDRYTAARVYGAFVYVENVNTGTQRLVQSERNGKYTAAGLPAGVYRVHVEYQSYCPEDPDFVSRYYPDQRNPSVAGSFALAPGQVNEWDPGVAPDADHDAMDDVWEDDFGLDPTRDDSLEDLDGDGFSNLDEYLLGTDPSTVATTECGCSGGDGAWLLLLFPPWLVRARRRDLENG